MRSKVVDQAKTWLGVKTGSPGHREILKIYNTYRPLARGYQIKEQDSWCAAFVSAVFIKIGEPKAIHTEVGAQRMIDGLAKIGQWVEDDSYKPQPGDLIFYDWQDTGKGDNKGWSDHVGIVVDVTDTSIITVEGNYDKSVKSRIVPINGRFIRGFGVLKVPAKEPGKKSTSKIVDEVIAGKWGAGNDRKTRLEKAGYNYATIQLKVNEKLTKRPTDLNKIAREVIAGKWSNGKERTEKLRKAGYDPTQIQDIVNAMLR